MKVLRILTYPNPVLHQISDAVTVFDEELKEFCASMLITMKTGKGLGLAAPQVGVMKRIITVCIDEKYPLVFVNPEIVSVSEETFPFREGCLSVPGYFEERSRAKNITLKFQDNLGVDYQNDLSDEHAFCVQHEIDHLNGRVFIDDLSPLKKDRIKEKIKKLRR